MTKETFIAELRKRLSLLDKKEIDDIIAEYDDFVKNKENEGMTEGLAIEQLGNVNELARKILKSYKISDNYINIFIGKEKLIDEINDFVTKLTDASSTVYIKIEESVSDFARTTGHVAKNVYKESIKFGEERLHDVKNIFKKNNKKNQENDENENNT